MDFAKLVEAFDAHDVTFVSVTQSFNTTTSMGRLTLNILLSFAQFEREVIGERIRDKFAASRARGMWMGGPVPLGYDVENRKLVVNEAGAATVRRVFEGFAEIGSATKLLPVLHAEGCCRKAGRPFDKGASTSCWSTGPTSARRCTRGRPIPASTRPSSRGSSGIGCTRSCRTARGRAARRTGRPRRRCCAG